MIINLNVYFKTVLFKGYSRRKNNREILASSNQTRIKSIVNLVAIGVETLVWRPGINGSCSLEKLFIKLICLNTSMVLFLIVNQVDSCQATPSPKCYILDMA